MRSHPEKEDTRFENVFSTRDPSAVHQLTRSVAGHMGDASSPGRNGRKPVIDIPGRSASGLPANRKCGWRCTRGGTRHRWAATGRREEGIWRKTGNRHAWSRIGVAICQPIESVAGDAHVGGRVIAGLSWEGGKRGYGGKQEIGIPGRSASQLASQSGAWLNKSTCCSRSTRECGRETRKNRRPGEGVRIPER